MAHMGTRLCRKVKVCIVDVHVFIPFAPSNAASSLLACYREHEHIKKKAYGQRIRENMLLYSCDDVS